MTEEMKKENNVLGLVFIAKGKTFYHSSVLR